MGENCLNIIKLQKYLEHQKYQNIKNDMLMDDTVQYNTI